MCNYFLDQHIFSEMKCIIPGINLKVFGRAIHSLAKIGDELYFEPLEQGLSLRTVNSSRSAYACFLFFPSYFQHYDDGKKQAECSDSEEEEEELRCKIIMKSVMAVFRSLSTIEKTVEKCKITHNAKEARLVFELHCRHGIVKKHNLAYIECETLQAIFSKDLCPNKLTAPSKLLCEVVVNFQTTQEEVTLTVRPDLLTLKNYVEDEPDPNKVVHTELSLAPEEFDLYQVGVDTDITFCLKELRAILAFGETTALPLNINFEAAGRPVTFCIDSDQTFEANFVLATLADAEQVSSQMPASHRGQQSASQSRHKQPAPGAGGKQGGGKGMTGKPGPSRNVHHNGDVSGPGKNTEPVHARTGPASSRAAVQEDDDDLGDISAEELAAAMEVERDWEIAERDRHPQTSDRTSPPGDQGTEKPASPHTRGAKNDEPSPKQKAGQSSSHRQGAKDRHAPAGKQERDRACGYQEERRKPHSRERERETSSCGQGRGAGDGRAATSSHLKRVEEGGGGRWGGHRLRTSQEDGGEEEGASASPVFPVQCATADVTREDPCLQPLSGEDDGEDDDLDETIPGTPPSTPPAKKFRSLFFGSSQKRSQPMHNTTVLAADTDEED